MGEAKPHEELSLICLSEGLRDTRTAYPDTLGKVRRSKMDSHPEGKG